MERDAFLSRFDVAIWQSWLPSECEIPFIGLVSAPDAAAAVVEVMRVFGVTRAGHVAAIDQARRFQHRAYGVQIPELEPALVQRVGDGLKMASRERG